jgi:hypothetical protein
MNRLCLFCVLSLVLFQACQKPAKDERFARIGSTVVMKKDFDAFMKMHRLYPSAMNSAFPRDRSPATFMVETEVLYRASWWGRGAALKSPDWKWKKMFFPAQLYMQEVIGENSGFPDKQIESWYKAHIDSFKVTQKIPVKRDTSVAGAAPAADSTRDTTFFRPLAEVRDRIKETLFCDTYPPDSAFYAEVTDSGDTAIDSAMVAKRWFLKWRRDMPTFFMQKEFVAQYGKPMPDSLKEWFGDGKLITPADMKVVFAWLSEERRESYNNEAGTKYLAEWLLKWKLFSKRANKTGYDKQADVADVIRWAGKLQVALDFLDRKLLPKVRQSAGTVDTSLCVFAFWDKQGTPGVMPDSAEFSANIREYADLKTGIELDRVIAKMRAKAGIEFLQSDWKDDKNGDPVKMMAEADSMLTADDARKAETKYGDIFKNFSYTGEGLKALTEMAKIQTEKSKYREAIGNYRKYSILSGDGKDQCNTFFMIGFIYDEYLNKSPQAEVHYQWILKNTPECELADDAEFMCLHLDEPMTSVEELQAEALRQGRKLDDSEPVAEIADTAEQEPAAK